MPSFQQGFFEQTADREPGSVAVDDHGAIVSYGALEEQANRIAHLLRNIGCGPNHRVCIFTGKNAHMYTAVLGTLKAGGCWVPLNTTFPVERLRQLLALLKPVAVLVDESTFLTALGALELFEADYTLILMGANDPGQGRAVIDQTTISAQPASRPDITGLTGEDLAYIIFTSGSTGAPKGVMVRHRNTTQFLSLCADFFDVARGSRFAHFSDLTFDPSIFDLFHCWQTGGVLVPANRRSYRIDPARFLIEQRIGVLFAVPTTLASVRDSGRLRNPALASLRHLLLTGEPVPTQLVRDWYSAQPSTSIYNMYGTTETSIVSHWCRIPRTLLLDDPVPLGKPLPGMRVMLLDGDTPVAPGAIGEAVVVGSQLSPGYWANPFQTRRVFVADPIDPESPVTAYRTGDLLREGPDGFHYFVGRLDSQVKVRGHRVELGEVENTLLANELVFEAAVVLVERPGAGSCLVAFVKADPSISMNALREYLAERLPSYMVPAQILPIVGDMPSGSTGKLDRNALKVLASRMLENPRAIENAP